MLALITSVNLFVATGAVLISAILGYSFRSIKIKSIQKKVRELENEMLVNHAEILQLQKEKIDILKSISEPASPVIPITTSKDDILEKLPNVSLRKKLMDPGSSPAKQNSGQ